MVEQSGLPRHHVRVPAAANVPLVVEVAVDSVAGAKAAVAAGAHRLELCSALELGGLTPSLGLLEAVVASVPRTVPVCAMLRPRAGDFLYDAGELTAMQRDAERFAAAGAGGLVAGVLRADGMLDRDRLQALRAAAPALPFTCHRAFDLCVDAFAALATLRELGCARVLTSGQAANAVAGAAAIATYVARAGAHLTVMAGAGVRAGNVAELVRTTGVREVHLSATAWLTSGMAFRRPGVPMGATPPADEYVWRTTDGAAVAAVVAALRSLPAPPRR
ncbi:MAG: copper homeostasis protein CutC [Planctomycetes bacterium]|nr:copper homeostasis protein CutC [Planctomycetota bacterium]